MNILSRFKENNFIKNIVIIAGGTAFAQMLNIAMSPIITRIYPPNEYGILSVYTSLLALLSIGASLDYQKAIPIVDNERSAYNLIVGAFSTLFLFIITLSLVLVFWGKQIIDMLNSEELAAYIYWIPIGVLFVGAYNIMLHWSLREKNFKVITQTKVTQSIISNFGKICLGLIGMGAQGLILGQIIGQSGGISRLSSSLVKKRKDIVKSVNLFEIKKQLIRYIKFPLFSASSNYIYTLGTQAPVIILTSIYGTKAAGFYGLASSITSLPISLLATSVSQVFYAEIASIGKENPRKIKTLSLMLSSKLALIGLGPLIVFLLWGPWLFQFIFGHHWYNAGIYARIIALIAYAHFVILPSGRILEVIEKQNISLLINIIQLSLVIIAFIAANILKYTAVQAVILYTIVSTIGYMVLFMVVQMVLSKD